jgi:peptide/nickel transport system substrate-binding protein
LTGAGYKWEIPPLESKGSAQQAKGLIMPDGQLVPNMTILSPSADYDTEMATSGQVIVEWLQDLGLSVTWKPMAFGALLQKVRYERDFDMFIMGWRGLSVDPDYLRRFFHSSYDSPNEWNYTGYHNADFDRLAEEQIERVNLQQRRKIVMDLQSQLTKDLPYIPLFVPHRMEGIRTDKFEGWTSISGGVGNIWTFCMLKPIRSQ